MMRRIGQREVSGQTFQVYVDSDGDGKWMIAEDIEGDEEGKGARRRILGTSTTLKGAMAQARNLLKSLEIHVEIPFTMANGRRAVARQLTRDEQVTAIADDGEIVKVHRWGEEVFKPDTPAEVTNRFAELRRLKGELDQEERALVRDWGYRSLRTDVEKAVQQRQEALDSASGK